MTSASLRLIEAAEAELIQETFLAIRAMHEAATYGSDGEDMDGLDVRVRVLISDDAESYEADFASGSPQYDQDHRGYWGSGWVCSHADDVDLTSLAREMVAEVIDAVATDVN